MKIMKNLNKTTLLLAVITALLVVGCNTEKEKHVKRGYGTERGVHIEVMLKNGGTAVLICPKFNSKPIGSHGRECYLDSYDK